MRQCVILVGGLGSRLGARSHKTPKPLQMIQGKPFIEYLIDRAVSLGFTEILLLAGHLGEQFVERYHGKKLKNGCVFKVHCEKAPGGTGGAIIDAWKKLDEKFFLLNGDSILDGNWLELIEMYEALDVNAMMALTRVTDQGRYGGVVCKENIVTAFKEKDPVFNGSGLINAGVYLLEKNSLRNLLQFPSSLETDVFPVLAGEGRLGGVEVEGYFIDIGIPETLKYSQENLIKHVRKLD
ncbi:sugar phosphate nucleotidyltransferase [Kiloniella litopenaei]|uniref:sugar phosphate nucleotidyltransferase n=1 Tax=Kiloniella litopenaei TaxID=1549748 RepID=UPI003BAABB82